MKAMILAAGLGSRLRPLTNDRPKALVEINGKTLLELTLLRLQQAGFKEIIINVHHHGQQIIDFVRNRDFSDLRIEFSKEDELLDTGGGLKKASWFFEDSDFFLVHNVDVLTDLDYRQLFVRLQETNALACLAIRQRKTQRYLLFDEQFRLCGWQNVQRAEKRLVTNETKPLTPYSFMGVQALSNKIFDFFPQQAKFSLIEAYLQIAEKGKQVLGLPMPQARWLDVGKPDSLKKAKERFADWFV